MKIERGDTSSPTQKCDVPRHSISNSFILDIDGAEEAQTGIHVYIVKENQTNWGWSYLLILDKKLTVNTQFYWKEVDLFPHIFLKVIKLYL